MNIEQLNTALYNSCIHNDICKEYQEWWGNEIKTQQELIDAIKKEPLFIYRLPQETFDLVKEEFDTQLMEENGIYVDTNISEINNYKVLLLGNSSANLTIENGNYIFYCYENSSIELNVTGWAIVTIYLFDEVSANITSDSRTTTIIQKIGKDSSIETTGNVKIMNRELIDNFTKGMYRR